MNHWFICFLKVRNKLSVKFDLLKTVFNVTEATDICHNSTNCEFPLHFFSSEKVIISVPAPGNSSSHDWDSTFVAHCICEPRMPLYLTFVLLMPIFLVFCAFRWNVHLIRQLTEFRDNMMMLLLCKTALRSCLAIFLVLLVSVKCWQSLANNTRTRISIEHSARTNWFRSWEKEAIQFGYPISSSFSPRTIMLSLCQRRRLPHRGTTGRPPRLPATPHSPASAGTR